MLIDTGLVGTVAENTDLYTLFIYTFWRDMTNILVDFNCCVNVFLYFLIETEFRREARDAVFLLLQIKMVIRKTFSKGNSNHLGDDFKHRTVEYCSTVKLSQNEFLY